jgi:hypothetical protein
MKDAAMGDFSYRVRITLSWLTGDSSSEMGSRRFRCDVLEYDRGK